MVKDFKRKVTHKGYRNPDKWKKHWGKVYKEISKSPDPIKIEWARSKNTFINITDEYIDLVTTPNVIVFLGGGTCLAVIISFLYFDNEWDIMSYIVFGICCIMLTYFIFYFFTKPKKEQILNRIDGLITFTGWYWNPNVTMRFEDVEFIFSTGGDDGSNAFQLEIIRPDKLYSREAFEIVGLTCYDDMSFITWYMDKNRPLPPGTAFDPYRQKDFERRKAEGFPPPLYESNIKTPEATKEQQDERDKYWRG